MPLYEYQCESCGKVTERIQKFSDPPLDTCPSCGGAVKKLLSSPAIQFKGSGWYITDYARKSGTDGKGAKTDKSSDSGSGDSKGEKSDSSSTPAASAPATKSE